MKPWREKGICVDADTNTFSAPSPVLLVVSAQADTPRRTPLCTCSTMASFAFDSQHSTTDGGPKESYILRFASFTMTIF